MLRRRVIAVLLALSSAAALTWFELLGSPLYLTKFSLLPPLALLIGLVNATARLLNMRVECRHRRQR